MPIEDAEATKYQGRWPGAKGEWVQQLQMNIAAKPVWLLRQLAAALLAFCASAAVKALAVAFVDWENVRSSDGSGIAEWMTGDHPHP